jgi:hypothetical protein
VRRVGNAWAVVDVERNDVLAPCDLKDTRERAIRLRDARQSVTYPIHPGAKWKVVRVMIYEIAI